MVLENGALEEEASQDVTMGGLPFCHCDWSKVEYQQLIPRELRAALGWSGGCSILEHICPESYNTL